MQIVTLYNPLCRFRLTCGKLWLLKVWSDYKAEMHQIHYTDTWVISLWKQPTPVCQSLSVMEKMQQNKKERKKKSPWQPSKEDWSLWWIEPFSWFWFGLPHFAAWAGQWTCTKNDNHTCYTHIKHHPYRHFELKWCLMKYNYEIGLIIKNKQQSNITNM